MWFLSSHMWHYVFHFSVPDVFTFYEPLLSSSLFCLPRPPGVGSDNVSGTLSSLPGHKQYDFDMFAQTRSSSLAEQRKK